MISQMTLTDLSIRFGRRARGVRVILKRHMILTAPWSVALIRMTCAGMRTKFKMACAAQHTAETVTP